MTPLQVTITKWVFVILAAFAAGFYLRDVQSDRDVANGQVEVLKDQAAAAKDLFDKFTKRDAEADALQTQLYSIDTQHTQVLNEALAENTRLASDLGVAQRMRLQGARCVGNPAGAQAQSAGAVGGDLQVELTGETRRAVWDLRESVIRDNEVIRYYQGYTEGLGLTPSPPAR